MPKISLVFYHFKNDKPAVITCEGSKVRMTSVKKITKKRVFFSSCVSGNSGLDSRLSIRRYVAKKNPPRPSARPSFAGRRRELGRPRGAFKKAAASGRTRLSQERQQLEKEGRERERPQDGTGGIFCTPR